MKSNANAELITQKRNIFATSRPSCQSQMSSATLVMDSAEWNNRHFSPDKHEPALLFRPLGLTDCCSLYSAIMRIQPRPQDRCDKLILNHIRGLRRCLDLSFADNACNLCDVETKHEGSLGILSHFMSTGVFGISSWGERHERAARHPMRLLRSYFLRNAHIPLCFIFIFLYIVWAICICVFSSFLLFGPFWSPTISLGIPYCWVRT